MWIKELLKSLWLDDEKIEQAVSAIDEEKSNLKKALEDERSKRKLSDEEAKELERLKNLESDIKEKDKKAKWEQNEIIEELKSKVKTLEEEKESLVPYKTKYEEWLEAQRNALLESIPEAKREFVNTVLDGKDHDTQVKLLTQFAEDYKTPPAASDPTPPSWWADPKDTSAYEQAKAKWDTVGMLKNAPTI